MYEGIVKLAPEKISEVLFGYNPQGGAILGDTALAPVIVTLFAGGHASQTLAAEATRAMGVRTPEPVRMALRRAFAAADTATTERYHWEKTRASLGLALRTLGDSTSVGWARATLMRMLRPPQSAGGIGRAGQDDAVGAAARIMADARDPAGVSLLIAVASAGVSPQQQPAIVGALAEYNTPESWGALISLVRSRHLPRSSFMYSLAPGVMTDSIVGRRAKELLREDLASGEPITRMNAIAGVRRLRLIELAPSIIAQLANSENDASVVSMAYTTLVALSGRADAPVYAPQTGLPSAAVQWWKSWLDSTNGRPVAVSPEDGARAVREWMARRPPR